MGNNRRIAAVIHTDKNCSDNVRKTVSELTACRMFDSIVVYRKPDTDFGMEGVLVKDIPAELDTEPKIRNWINSEYASCGGFLHVIKDDTEITRPPAEFVSDVEKMMDVFDYPVWLSTVTDSCNYVYSKYNPRITIAMNRQDVNDRLGLKTDICVTSHSNTYWMIYDMPKLVGSNLVRFDDRYTVPMFYIIEFLARRRNEKKRGDMHFMNQYLTVRSELGVFKQFAGATQKEDDVKTLQEEDKLFKSQDIDFTADMNIDVILETFWEKLASKAGISLGQ